MSVDRVVFGKLWHLQFVNRPVVVFIVILVVVVKVLGELWTFNSELFKLLITDRLIVPFFI